MPSFVWDRDPREAYSNPYEYAAQEQFAREAMRLLDLLHEHYAKKDRTYHRDDTSAEKAVWMLQVDSVESLRDALLLTEEKKHRMSARLFRDALETLDLSFYFAKAGPNSAKDLRDWYADEVVPHRVAREFVKSVHGAERWESLKALYGSLSKYTHRIYRALAKSYILARDDILVYDGFRKGSVSLVLPHVISFSYAVLAMLIQRFVEVAVSTLAVSRENADSFWRASIESESAPRRFASVMPSIHYVVKANDG